MRVISVLAGRLDKYMSDLSKAVGGLSSTPRTPWQTGVSHDLSSGEITTGPQDDDCPDWDSIFRYWNLDPNAWETVDGTLRVNAWEGPTVDGTKIFRQYKAQIRRKLSTTIDADKWLERLCKYKASKPKDFTKAEASTFVAMFTDWQVGDCEEETFLDRLCESLDGVIAQAKKSKSSNCLIAFGADMIEGVAGQYASQTFTVKLNLRDQVRVARAGEALIISKLSPLFSETIVVAVPGNHGLGNLSKPITDLNDNWDLAICEMVKEQMDGSGFSEAHNVQFEIPTTSQIVCVETSGSKILVAHSDQVRGSADKVRDWWRKVSFTRWGAADEADILITGHRHHFRAEELAEARWWFQAPALDSGSRWFAEIGGGTSKAGTLTFVTADSDWWNLHIA